MMKKLNRISVGNEHIAQPKFTIVKTLTTVTGLSGFFTK